MSQEDNIFSMAGKHSPKPKPKAPEKKQDIRLRFGQAALPPPDPVEERELKSRYEQFQKMRDELDKNLDELYAQAGMTKDSLVNYLDNSSNYSDEEYAEMQKRRKILKAEVWKMAGREAKEKTEKKAESKQLKKKKRKTLGARRRNWLNMR